MENNFDWLQLPVEVWLHILEYLDLPSLLITSELCHSFNSIIGTSKNFINKIRLSIHFKDDSTIEKSNDFVRILQSSHRQYTIINMKNYSEKSKVSETIQILTKFNNSLKELSLEEYIGLPEASACDFPNLKKLTLLYCAEHWMKYFSNCNQLTFLNVKKRPFKAVSKDDFLGNFLLKQTCLKELIISGNISHLFKNDTSFEASFRLHKLSIDGYISFIDLNSSLQFFETQNQLREIKICEIWWFAIENKKIFREIFMKNTLIESVEFTSELDVIPSYTYFLNGEFTHYGVKKLSFKYLHCTMFHNKLFTVLAQMFPNVKAFCLQELNDLPIAHISCKCICDVFPSIESLTISHMANVNATVKGFCQKLRKLKSLKMSQKNFEHISTITKVECQRAGISISF